MFLDHLTSCSARGEKRGGDGRGGEIWVVTCSTNFFIRGVGKLLLYPSNELILSHPNWGVEEVKGRREEMEKEGVERR
jgi:hypothetical protein